MTVSRETPAYRSHKKVRALKIASITGSVITPAEEGYTPFDVSQDYMLRHNPHVGGYYVVYEDGYKSFSPAKAFEDGYTEIKTLGRTLVQADDSSNCAMNRNAV